MTLSSIIAGSMIGGYLFNSVITPSVAGTDLPEHKEPGIVAIIATVQIDIATGEVKISGSGLSDEVIQDTVSVSGFTSI